MNKVKAYIDGDCEPVAAGCAFLDDLEETLSFRLDKKALNQLLTLVRTTRAVQWAKLPVTQANPFPARISAGSRVIKFGLQASLESSQREIVRRVQRSEARHIAPLPEGTKCEDFAGLAAQAKEIALRQAKVGMERSERLQGAIVRARTITLPDHRLWDVELNNYDLESLRDKYLDYGFHEEFYSEFMVFLKVWRMEVKAKVAREDIRANQAEHTDSIRSHAVWCWIVRWLVMVDTPSKSVDVEDFELLQRARLVREDASYAEDLLLKDMRKWFTKLLYDE
ncbi:MAG: hypothetical protein Q9207_002165 [Kuettlingeria erythrocarpa]